MLDCIATSRLQGANTEGVCLCCEALTMLRSFVSTLQVRDVKTMHAFAFLFESLKLPNNIFRVTLERYTTTVSDASPEASQMHLRCLSEYMG